MTREANGNTGAHSNEADFAQAFQELSRGERTATALEHNLSALEKKIEELLAKADEEEKTRQATIVSTESGPSKQDEGT